MPGWIVQGVRGEGKSLCAVAKMREYLSRGCPVATNLDLFLDNLLPEDSSAIAYRLPDRPRFQDFLTIPPAYDVTYKSEDKNGLIVLDELALWMNSRTWKDSGRQEIINWLLLSRKYHWDLMLLTQDHELIDKQIKVTVCDYLVQASRTDRRKIPYLAPLLEFCFLSGFQPQIHVYDVYYGMSFADSRVEQWRFRGKDLYDGYDTNQLFTDGKEILNNQLVDMRAIYTYLPVCYLSKQIFIKRLNDQINDIQSFGVVDDMAKQKINSADSQKAKIIMLSVFLVGFLVWRVGFGDLSLPGNHDKTDLVPALATTASNVLPVNDDQKKEFQATTGGSSGFLDVLVTRYRPRLAALISGKKFTGETVISGLVEFYDGEQLVETFRLDQLKSFGCSFVLRPYGGDIITSTGTYAVTSWPRPDTPSTEPFPTKT